MWDISWNMCESVDIITFLVVYHKNDCCSKCYHQHGHGEEEKCDQSYPIINLWSGSACLKSLNRNGDERIEKNVTTDVKEKVRESTSVTVKTIRIIVCWGGQEHQCSDLNLLELCRLQQRQRWLWELPPRSSLPLWSLAILWLNYEVQNLHQRKTLLQWAS